jgi:cobalt transporter subunit CbtA
MLFRRFIISAFFAGVVAGLLLSLVQILTVNPIIFAAEAYEVVADSSSPAVQAIREIHTIEPKIETTASEGHHDDHGHSHSQGHSQDHSQSPSNHQHSHDGWAPEDGAERTSYTVFANIFAGIGFAAILLSLMSQIQVQGFTQLNAVKGLLWGVGGFMAFFVAPSIGMPPEIPGMIAAPIEHRQLWWMLAVLGVGLGLLLLAFAPIRWKGLGVVAIVLPYLVGVPHLHGGAFDHPDPLVVQELMALQQNFILYSGLSNLLLWLALGGLCGWLLNRRVFSAGERD